MINEIINIISLVHSTDDVEVIVDETYPFPEFELEILWNEWRWNDARTDRMDEVDAYGITFNPDDYSDEDGNLNAMKFSKEFTKELVSVINNPERTGTIEIRA